MSPAPPPVSTFRYRLFRPHRWRLWVQFLLFGGLTLLVPLFITAGLLLQSGGEVLIEHETIDLSDESQLRVNEFREDLSYLAADVRRAVERRGQATPAGILEDVNAIEDGTVKAVRRRYLGGAVAGAFGLGAGWTPRAGSGVDAALAEARQRREREDKPTGWSGLHRDAGGLYVAYAARDEDGKVYGLAIDFGRYVHNRQRVSPRHLYLVADPQGRLLDHPTRPDLVGRGAADWMGRWEEPAADGLPCFGTEADEKRVAAAVKAGGVRLKAEPVPGLACVYRKGYLGDRRRVSEQGITAEQLADLKKRTGDLLNADELLRVGEVVPASQYVEVAHPDKAKLQAACDVINAWWKGCGKPGRVDWGQPLPCPTMQGQLVPLRVDLNDTDAPPWLVVAASPDELKTDIDERFAGVFVWKVLPVVAAAVLAGIVLVWLLTLALNKLADAAARLTPEAETPLPLGGPYEVSQLARTLQILSTEVQERDRLLRDRAARYETILRAAGEGVLVTTAGGVIEEANRAAGRMFGGKAEALVGRPISSLFARPDLLPTAGDDESSSQLSDARESEAMEVRRADGSTFWAELNLKPVPLRDRVVVVCVLRDVTQRKQVEEQRERLNDELEVRVKQRTAELEEANGKLEVALRQAEAAARAKDTFVATMSHELRQPLHIIIGFTEALKEEAADLGAANIEPDLNKILAAAKHLLDLINDILDMAKIAAGKMELSIAPFRLPELVGEVKTLVEPLAAKNANQFNVDAPADLGVMTADARRVRQVLINLLSNAFKFTSQGRVDLRVRRVVESGREWVRFAVSDTGRGMTADQVSRLFQRFYQADGSTTRDAGGTGLGLAITQSFNDLMGGQPVRVTSQPGFGTEFVVSLPAVVTPLTSAALPPPPPASTAAPALAPPAAGRTVLVVDDDPMVRELMGRFLAKDGFRVLLAANGEDGMRMAKEERPALITLDVAMPGADGWGVLGHLKADPETADIPVVMLTIVDDRGRGFALGATEYLTKPIDWNRLGAILRRYLTDRSDEVLVIDDDPANRLIVRRHLEREGWTVTEAADGEVGLKAFDTRKPGLILLDLMMPVLDGFGFLDAMNRQHPGHRVPVVVLTAKDLTPTDFDRLNGRVARILEKGDLNHLDALLELIRRAAKR